MKSAPRTLAAVALICGCRLACAQSSVTVYGVADMYLGAVRNISGSAPQGSVAAINSGGLTTSFIGFRGQEDLGDGMAAVFALESYLRMDTGVIGRNDSDPLWGRASNVGLNTPYGRVTLGRHVTPYSLAATTFTPLKGTTAISPIFATTFRGNVQGDTRFNNSMRYVSPDMNGWNVDVVGSLGRENPSGPDERRDRAVDGSLRYTQGPLNLVVATRQINLNAKSDDHKQKAYMTGVLYDFNVVKLNAQYHWTKETFNLSAKDITRKTYEVGASVPFGRGDFSVSWSASNIDRPLASGVADKRKSYVIAYDYNLSKRTDLYAGFYRDQQDHPDILQRQTVAGIRHSF